MKNRRDQVTPDAIGLRTRPRRRSGPGVGTGRSRDGPSTQPRPPDQSDRPRAAARRAPSPPGARAARLARRSYSRNSCWAGRRPSIPRMFFLDPLTRDLHRNWDELARVHVAYLRLTAGRFPSDARLANLIGELSMRSDQFAQMWATGEVSDCTTGDMHLQHPTVGATSIAYQVWLQPDSPDHRLEVYTPNDASSADALQLLNRHIADEDR
nr:MULTISPECIES: hypothetical protein [unclassified Mycolicibacterium]